MNSGILEVSLGEQGADVIKHSQVPIKRGQVAGLAFYESSDIENHSEPIVRLKQGNLTLDFPIARSVLLTAAEKFGEGVEDVDIELKLPEPPKDATRVAELETYDRAIYALVTDVIARINKAGWKRYIDPSEPRIAGMATYRLSSGGVAYRPEILQASDPLAVLTFEDWKLLEEYKTHSWQWFADGVFINVGYNKDGRNAVSTILDDVRITIESVRLIMSRSDPKGEGNVERGRDAYRKSIAASLAIREREEAKARAAGLKILEDWVDPPIGNVVVPHK